MYPPSIMHGKTCLYKPYYNLPILVIAIPQPKRPCSHCKILKFKKKFDWLPVFQPTPVSPSAPFCWEQATWTKTLTFSLTELRLKFWQLSRRTIKMPYPTIQNTLMTNYFTVEQWLSTLCQSNSHYPTNATGHYWCPSFDIDYRAKLRDPIT